MTALGELIRETRESKGLSLQAVSSATKIRENILTALENESYDDLPAPVYVRGLLRTLARQLGLDANQLLAMYKSAVPQSDISDPTLRALTVVPKPETVRPRPNLMRPAWQTPSVFFMAFVTLLLVAGVTWGSVQVVSGLTQLRPTNGLPTNSLPTNSLAVAEPTATPPFALNPTRVASPTPALTPFFATTATPLPHPTNFELKLDATARSWVRVEADGAEAFQGILEAGASKMFTARNRFTMRAGNGGGVTATVNGQSQGALGGSGDVVDRQWVLAENGTVATAPPTWTNPPNPPTPTPQR